MDERLPAEGIRGSGNLQKQKKSFKGLGGRDSQMWCCCWWPRLREPPAGGGGHMKMEDQLCCGAASCPLEEKFGQKKT